MAAALLLIEIARRDEEVERCLKRLLGIMEQRLPTIPPSCPKSTRRGSKAGEGHGEVLICSVFERLICHGVRAGIELGLRSSRLRADASGETTDTTEIGFHISTPLAGDPGIAVFLQTRGGVDDEVGGAVGSRGVEVVASSIGGYAHVIDLMEIIKAGTC